MIRREFIQTLGRLLGLAALPTAAQPPRRHLIQQCPLAGFQFHQGEDLWPYLSVGDTLHLVREPGNPHDSKAIRVDWNGRQLGYLPRRQNQAAARMLDEEKCLEARIGALRRHSNPWQRVEIEVWLVV